MLTLKFHDTSRDYWEVYTADRYAVELNQEDILAVRKVHLGIEGTEEPQRVSESDGDWDVCYVVNDRGNTIDRIISPKFLQEAS